MSSPICSWKPETTAPSGSGKRSVALMSLPTTCSLVTTSVALTRAHSWSGRMQASKSADSTVIGCESSSPAEQSEPRPSRVREQPLRNRSRGGWSRSWGWGQYAGGGTAAGKEVSGAARKQEGLTEAESLQRLPLLAEDGARRAPAGALERAVRVRHVVHEVSQLLVEHGEALKLPVATSAAPSLALVLCAARLCARPRSSAGWRSTLRELLVGS